MSLRSSIAVLIAMVAVRLLTLLALMKFLSITLGPDRFGILSQIMGIAAMFYMFAGGGLTYGLIKNVAASRSREAHAAWLGAASAICAVISVLLAGVAGALYFLGAETVLGDARLAPVFLAIGAAQVVMGCGHMAFAYLSGSGDLRSFATVNCVGNILGLAIVLALTLWGGFDGAAYGVALLPVVPGLLAVGLLACRARSGAPRLGWPPDGSKLVELLKFSSVMVLAATSVPLAQLFIRADLAHSVGWQEVGYWQSIARLSDAYMQVFAVLCINFLLPQLSSRDRADRVGLLSRIGKILIALFLFGAVLLYILRDVVVRVAYSTEFLPATVFVAPQLVGDFAKLASAILVYYFVAEGRRWVQGGAEVFQAIGLLLLYVVLEPSLGSRAAVFNHVGACAALLIALIVLFSSARPDRARWRKPSGADEDRAASESPKS